MGEILLNRVTPYENESLGSVMERLAKVNHYDERRWLDKYVAEEGAIDWRSNPSVAYRTQQLEKLYQITGIEFINLYQATVHNLARRVFPDTAFDYEKEVPFLKDAYIKKHIDLASIKYCPGCLSEGSKHLIHWQFNSVTSCSQHATLLVQYCSKCNGKITIGELISGYHRCGAVLAKQEAHCIYEDQEAMDASIFMESLIGVRDKKYVLDDLNDPIFSLPDPLLYVLIEGFTKALRLLRSDSLLLKTSTLSFETINNSVKKPENMKEKHLLIASALKMLSEWPKNFIMFLREYRIQQPRKALGLNQEFKNLRKILESLQIEFVQQIFSGFLIDEWDGLLDSRVKEFRQFTNMIDTKKYLSVEEAARILKLGRRQVSLLIENKIVASRKIYSDKHYYYLVRRDSIEKLAEQKEQYLTLEEVSEKLGVEPGNAKELIKAGFIEQEEFIKGSSLTFVKKSSADDFEDKYLSNLRPVNNSKKYISILDAAYCLRFHTFPFAKIVELIENEAFEPFISSEGRGLAGVRLLLSEVQEYYSLLAKETKDNFDRFAEPLEQRTQSKEVLLSRYRVARLLGVSSFVIDDLGRIGLLPFTERKNRNGNTVNSVKIQDFLRFRREYLFTDQAAQYLQITSPTLLRWLHLGRINPCSEAIGKHGKRYLFRKIDLERLTPENTMTTQEVAKALNLNLGTVHGLIKYGKLIPISGPGVDGFKQYLFSRKDIEDYKVIREQLISIPNAAQLLETTEYQIRKLISQSIITPERGPLIDGYPSNLILKDQIENIKRLLIEEKTTQIY
ncbi:MAG: helix-turn-helix domain-containing protein [Syntrophomonadaceae bacterium]|nr:helix-turn-helix domain-containing protein [Syntrophomonadaceae bacterium]